MTTQSTPTPTDAVVAADAALFAASISAPDGAAIEVGSRYTHVFQRETGDWRLLSAQGTRIN